MDSLDLLMGGNGGVGTPHKFYGKYRGIVRDNNDPLKRGRIQASVPSVLGDVTSAWAMPCTPYAGLLAGQYTIPPVNAGVWIEFEAGDVDLPIWSGCWWAMGELPIDEKGKIVEPSTKILRSDTGLMVALDDNANKITISDATGLNIMTIEVAGTIKIQALAQVVLEAPRILLGEGATHPQVFGDLLLTYLNQLVAMFNAHVHPGELAAGFIPVTPAPPVPPFPPATPSLLSVIVAAK